MANNKNKPPEFIDYVLGHENFFGDMSPDLKKLNPIGRVVDTSVKEALTLTASSPSEKVTTIPYEFLDDPDELDTLSPSQVSVSLNVGDLVTNPIKTTKDFITKSFKSVTNVSGDIDNILVKESIWKPLAQGKKPGSDSKSNILEKAIGAGMYGTVMALDPTAAPKGVGFSSDITDGLADFRNTETAYQMGHGDIEIASNPGERFVDIFANGMSSLSSTSNREDSFTNISLGVVDILDAQVTRDHQHDYSYILGSEVSDILNARVDTYTDGSVDPKLNPMYKRGNKSKIVDTNGNSALTQSIEKVKKSQDILIEQQKKRDEIQSKISSLNKKLAQPNADINSINAQISSLEKSLERANERVEKSEKQYNRDSFELIGDGTAGSTGLLQNITSLNEISSLDPSNPAHKEILDVIDTFRTASTDPNELFEAIKNDTLRDKTDTLTSIAVSAAIDTSDSSFIFRTQKSALDSVNSFSKNINNSFSKGFSLDNSNSNFSAQDLVSNKDKAIIKKLERKIRLETNASEKAKLKEKLDLVKHKSENGLSILLDNTKLNVDSELSKLVDFRSKLGTNAKALKEFDQIFGKHQKNLEKLKRDLDGKNWSRKRLHNALKKQNSIYSTNTMGGGIKDHTSRQFMDTLFYKKDSEISRVFRESVDPDTFKRAKIMHRIARNEYENELADEVLKIFDKGPEGVVNYLSQRYIKERFGLASNVQLSFSNILKENLLKPLAYGGLMASDSLEEELGDAPGLKGFLYRNFGRRFSNLIGKNKFKFKIDGKSITLLGGAHFAGGVGIGNLINSGKLTDLQITKVLNAKDIKSIEGVLKGLIFKKEDMKALEKDIENLGKFREWLKTPEGKKLKDFLGITFDKDGNMVMNSKLSKFFQSLAARANNSSLIGPTVAFASALTKVSQFLSVLQGKFKNIIIAIRKPMAMLKKVVVTAITNFLTGLVSGVTGGLGIVLRVFIKAVVQKLVDLGSKFLAGILKGDIDKFTDALEETFKTFAKWLFLLFLPIIIIFGNLSDISSLTSAIPTSKVTSKPVSTPVPKFDPAAAPLIPVPGPSLNYCIEDTGLGIFTNGGSEAATWIDYAKPNMVVLYDNLAFSSSIDSDVLVVGRSQNFSDVPEDVNEAINVIRTELPRLISSYPDIDVWQGFNEPIYSLVAKGKREDEALAWLIDYETELHRIITGMGKEVCLGNFKEAFPTNLGSAAFGDYIDFAKNLDDAYLCVHEHEDSADNWGFGARYNGRFTQINENIGLPVLVTVMGIDSQAGPSASSGVGYKDLGISDEDYLDLLLEYNEEALNSGAEGVAVFQLGLGGWESFDVASLIGLECAGGGRGSGSGGGSGGRRPSTPTTDCSAIEERASNVSDSCAICNNSSRAYDFSPYKSGIRTFTSGFEPIINAAAADYNIPAAALAAVIYAEGWSENNSGYDLFEGAWTKDNVCSWSVPEGETIPQCIERQNPSTKATGPFAFIPSYFDNFRNNINSQTPIPRDSLSDYTHCNLLDSAYAAAAAIKQLANAAGITDCDSSWLEPMGTQVSGYTDGLDLSTAPKIQWVLLHYSCGINSRQCSLYTWVEDYSKTGKEAFEAMYCGD